MSQPMLLALVVRKWAEDMLPGQPAAASAAARVALHAYAGGASFSEACREARRFVSCWARHPAHDPARREEPLSVAS